MTATKNPVVTKKAKKKIINSVKKGGKIQKRQKQDIKKPQGIKKKLKSLEIAPHTLNSSKVTQGVSELLRLNEEFKKSKSELFDTEGQPVFMCETSDIALIVRDLEPRKRRPDNDAVVQLYESRLHTHGVKHPIKVMPIRQVMTEFNTYEAKRQLSNQFDIFLADAHISSRLTPILGKVFTQKRVNPIPVKIDDGAQMKKSIEKALAKTCMKISADGGTMTVQVGHTLQTAKEISENIIFVAEELTKSFPGGWLNIRNIILKTATSPGIPLYVAIRKCNLVIKSRQYAKLKLKHGQSVEGELSTQMDKVVRVTPSGNVVVKEPKSSDKSQRNKAKKAKRKLKKQQQQQQLKDDDEDLEDLEEDEVSEMEEEQPVVEEEKPATYESDSEDPEADEAEEAYLSELHSTTSHLQKNNKAKKRGADDSKETKSPKKSTDKKTKNRKEEHKSCIC
ncbi:hypothetical protein B566_EDAN003725 [Ephemera danica]|nr:hypothetical protein B566_EDAN003725 [Ephemera danica]